MGKRGDSTLDTPILINFKQIYLCLAKNLGAHVVTSTLIAAGKGQSKNDK